MKKLQTIIQILFFPILFLAGRHDKHRLIPDDELVFSNLNSLALNF